MTDPTLPLHSRRLPNVLGAVLGAVALALIAGACVIEQTDDGDDDDDDDATPIECPEGLGDCNVDAADGCEAEFASTPAHCGMCGHDCGGGNCFNGECAAFLLAEGSRLNSIAMDATHLYVVSSAAGQVERISKDGMERVPLAGTYDTDVDRFIAVDETHVYWSDDVTIRSVPKEGGPVTDISTSGYTANEIAMDATDVYWLEGRQGNPESQSIRRVSKQGGGATTLATDTDMPTVIAVDAEAVYWANHAYRVKKLAKAGGEPVTLASKYGTPDGIYGLAVVDGVAHFTHYQNNEVLAVPTAGGSVTTIAADQIRPDRIFVSATDIFWINDGYWESSSSVGLMQMPRTGGEPVQIGVESYSSGIADVVADEGAVYWLNGSGIRKLVR